MDLGLKNKIALVAASSKGLGRASAEAIAAEGARVTICARNADALEKTRAEMAAAGADVLAVPADMTNPADIANVVARTVEHFGGLHILVTNAGGPPPGYFPDFDDAAWESAVNLTLMSTVRLIRAALPHMQQAGWGRIINVTSISVKQPVDNLVLSNAIRAAVHGLAKTLANQVARDGITVNNVLPGYTHTDRIQQLAEARAADSGKTPADIIAGLGQPVPVGRVGQPHEFGATVAFLASEQAAYINGVSLPVDGGYINAAF
ncbi:MAG: SDR family oxidoreductase [Chloroflexi bacterium]|nr:MAG: SDR family oxidoreductase [Chloroflexota bacterium]